MIRKRERYVVVWSCVTLHMLLQATDFELGVEVMIQLETTVT